MRSIQLQYVIYFVHPFTEWLRMYQCSVMVLRSVLSAVSN